MLTKRQLELGRVISFSISFLNGHDKHLGHEPKYFFKTPPTILPISLLQVCTLNIFGSGTFSTLGQVPPRTFSTLDLFHPELLPLWDIFHPGTFFTLGPAVAKGWGGKSSGWIRSKSSGWKRSGVELVPGWKRSLSL